MTTGMTAVGTMTVGTMTASTMTADMTTVDTMTVDTMTADTTTAGMKAADMAVVAMMIVATMIMLQYDQEGGGEYDRSRYGSEEFEQQEENVILRYLYENEWLMWVLLVVLPPLGIWILWKRDRFDIMVRSIISAVSAIWFIIALVWMFGGFRGGNDVTTGPNAGGTINLVQPSALPSASAAVSGASGTPILSATPTPSPSASAGTNTSNTGSASTPRPNNNSGTTTTTDPNQNAVVYANASGRYYHLHSTCPEMNMTTPGTPMSVASARAAGQGRLPRLHYRYR